MSKFIYRFRPTERLLGATATSTRDEIPSELKLLEMYLATPEQLNDPLEGYRNVFWSGDLIVWVNLLRHYIYSCINHYAKLVQSETEDEIPKTIHVYFTSQDVEGDLKNICKDVSDKFFSEGFIYDYINKFSESNRKVYRRELIAHLKILHPHIHNLTLDALITHGFIHLSEGQTRKKVDRTGLIKLQLYGLNAVQGHSLSDIYVMLASMMEQDDLINSLQNPLFKNDPVHHFMYACFPEEFCTAINSLMIREWYAVCFMSECHDSSLWGTYGDSHKGICLKYRADHFDSYYSLPLFLPNRDSSGNVKNTEAVAKLEKVEYTSSHEEVNFFESLSNVPQEDLDNYWYRGEGGDFSTLAALGNARKIPREIPVQALDGSILKKMKVWEKENEYRLIVSPTTFSLENPANRKIHYKIESLDGVIFGIKTPMSVKAEVIKLLSTLSKKHSVNINVYQARYDDVTSTIIHDRLDKIVVQDMHF